MSDLPDVREQIRRILTTTDPKMQRAYTQPADVPFSAEAVRAAVEGLRQQHALSRNEDPSTWCVACAYIRGDTATLRQYTPAWMHAEITDSIRNRPADWKPSKELLLHGHDSWSWMPYQ